MTMDAPSATAERPATPVPAEFAAYLPPALAEVNVPAYVIDDDGIVRWLNPAAEAIVGPVEGHPFTECVSMDPASAQKVFSTRLKGEDNADPPVVMVRRDGEQTRCEVSSVQLQSGHRVVGMFGLAIPGERRPPPVHDS